MLRHYLRRQRELGGVRSSLGQTLMFRKRGNPNWGRPMPSARGLATATAFEMQVRQLQLTPENYVFSDQLREWCERNRNRFYIPEWLLKAWDIPVNPDFSGVA